MTTTSCCNSSNNECSVSQLTKSRSCTVSTESLSSSASSSEQTSHQSQEAAECTRARSVSKINVDATSLTLTLPNATTFLPCSTTPPKSTGASIANVSCSLFAAPTAGTTTLQAGDPQLDALPPLVASCALSPAPIVCRESHKNGPSLCSCLGDVQPRYEALKVGLESDDSSLDSDGSDDNDFFFGDGHDHTCNVDCSSDPNDSTMTLDYFHKPSTVTRSCEGLQFVVPTIVPPPSLSSEDQPDRNRRFASPFVPPLLISLESCTLPLARLSTSFEPGTLMISDKTSSQSDISPTFHPVSSSSETLTTYELTNNTSRESLLTEASAGTAPPLATSSYAAKHSRKRQKKRRVSLHTSVAIIPIPSRSEYSSPMQRRLWSSSHELFANAARNSVEFASEGWNWRNVTEDENMLVHESSGELIHPVHLQNALACRVDQEKESEDNVEDLLRGIVPNRDFSKKKQAECSLEASDGPSNDPSAYLLAAVSVEHESATMSASA